LIHEGDFVLVDLWAKMDRPRANMDNLETREDRLVMKQTCFSIEPGIYQSQFGVRSEVDVYVDAEGQVHVTGGELQTEIVRILSDFV
jgi:Xaa-Pro dipeptidase